MTGRPDDLNTISITEDGRPRHCSWGCVVWDTVRSKAPVISCAFLHGHRACCCCNILLYDTCGSLSLSLARSKSRRPRYAERGAAPSFLRGPWHVEGEDSKKTLEMQDAGWPRISEMFDETSGSRVGADGGEQPQHRTNVVRLCYLRWA